MKPVSLSFLVALVLLMVSPGVGLAGGAPLITGGDELLPGQYHLLVPRSDGRVTVEDLGLREAGLAPARVFHQADEIRVFADADNLNIMPRARIWLDDKGTYRFWSGGDGDAGSWVIPEGAAVLVFLRVSKNPIPWPTISTGEADRSP